MELQKGRPKYTAGRLEKEIRTYDLLDKLGVAYDRRAHMLRLIYPRNSHLLFIG